MEKKTKNNNTNKKKTETKKKSVVKKTNTARKNTKSSKKEKKKTKAFTLIELLAVIIILGVLMIIAIPSVTTYISNSRKSAYIDTAKNIVDGARNLVNEGKMEMYDTTATYYIPISCIKIETGLKTPYGEFESDGAYVGVTFDGSGYNYYWISNDTSGQGIKEVTPLSDLNEEKIVSGIKAGDVNRIIQETGKDGRNNIIIYNSDCTEIADEIEVSNVVYPEGKTKKTVVTGDIVKIGDEEFYVVKKDGTQLVLLAHYNLKVGNIYDSSGTTKKGEYASSDDGYGIQSSDAKGFVTGADRNGTVAFSTEKYWDGKVGTDYPGNYCTSDDRTNCAYICDSNSNLYQYINSYKTYLESFGVSIKSARLLKLEEANELGCRSDYCNDAPAFVKETSYWLGSAYDPSYIWVVSSDNRFGYGYYYYDYYLGVRPVIVI